MRIACLQFAPQLGDIDNNLNRADSVLSRANPKDIDLLVLPELAFSGYNFSSLQHISPYLEPTTSGITSLWARTIALKHNCHVIVGYPEKVDVSPKWPASPEYYNSAITVNPEGETIANYRKSFLYYTDETWALEGTTGFFDGEIEGLGNVAMGICMDLNPYKFEAPWNAWEFAHHVLHRDVNLVVISMAWLTRADARSFSREPKEPDMDTLSYWLSRLEPIIRNEGEEEIICVFANRCGVEDDAVYAGTSAVLGIQSGEVKVYGILGRGEKELLVVDTSKRAQMQLISEPKAPTTQAPSKSLDELLNVETTQSIDSILNVEPSSPTSSTASIAGSAKSGKTGKGEKTRQSGMSAIKNALSLNTGLNSLEPPPIDNLAFSPISPVDHPFKQAFFDPQDPIARPASRSTKERKPTPSPHNPIPRPASRSTRERKPTPAPTPIEPFPSTAFPPAEADRYTPIPHSRPSSPKSRNASRSRGPTLMDSPPMDKDDSPNEIRFSRSHFSNYFLDSPVLGEFAPEIAQSKPSPQFDDNNILESVSVDAKDHKPYAESPIHGTDIIAIVHGNEIIAIEERKSGTKGVGKKRAGSENSSQYKSSFTTNSLGPRSRHVLPRPRSTQW